MKHPFVIQVFLLFCLSLSGQQHPDCGLNRQLEFALTENPDFWDTYTSISGEQAHFRNEIVLPVVVHVIYSEEKNNISDFQILSQIDALNTAFAGNRKLSQDILPEHREVIGHVGIRFELACRDSLGNPTNGITRTLTNIPDIGNYFDPSGVYAVHHTDLGGMDPWPVEDYINIWVAEMESSSLGRATLPIPLSDPNEEGIVINSDNFGYAGTAYGKGDYDEGMSLVHEMGHYLGLFHPWGPGGGSCGVDDLIDDTPLQSEIYYDCPDESNSESCGSADMSKNIMGYADDACLQYFTIGQGNYMLNILETRRTGLQDSPGIANCGNQQVAGDEMLIWNHIETREWVVYFPAVQSTIQTKIYNMSGSCVARFDFENTDFVRLNFPVFPAGLYVVEFEYDGIIEQRKLNLF